MSDRDAARRWRVVEGLMGLTADDFAEVESLLQRLQNRRQALTAPTPAATPGLAETDAIEWPHAPPHRISRHGTFIVTAGTLYKEHHFQGPDRLSFLHSQLLERSKQGGWQLEAWAVFSNHYHFVAHGLEGADPLGEMVKGLHRVTAIHVNRLDAAEGRQVWYNYRDTPLTYETSYLARLAYVQDNPVKHGIVPNARLFRWCSAGWYELNATPAQVATLAKVKTDSVNVYDDFDPV